MGKYTQELSARLRVSKPKPTSTVEDRQFRPDQLRGALLNTPLYYARSVPLPEPEKPVIPTAESTNLMNGEYFPRDEYPADKGFWNGHCNRGQCLRPGAKWYNFGAHAYYCGPCADMLSNDAFNKHDAERTWGPGKRLCELQPTEESIARSRYK